MNTRTIILIMGSVLIATVCILVSVFVYRLIFVNTDNTAVKNPSINIQLVTVPTKIDTICQPVTFLLNVKNTGEVDFNHDLFKNGLAQFDVIIKGVGDLILQSKTGGTTFDNLKITDFGNIAPGETKQISITADQSTAVFKDNGFSNMQINGNGNYTLVLRAELYNGGSSYTIFSNEPAFDVAVNAFVQSGSNWTNKLCN